MKTCTKCGEEKPLPKYYPKYGTNQLRSQCKTCDNKRGEARKRRKHGGVRGLWLFKQYGISLEDYETLLEAQNGTCAICEAGCANEEYLRVDHDHDTGEVRGLLCHSCNSGIGFLKDSPEVVLQALEYLSR